MKKIILALVLGLFLLTSSAFATTTFDKLEGLSAVQQQKLSQIQFNFKQKIKKLNLNYQHIKIN